MILIRTVAWAALAAAVAVCPFGVSEAAGRAQAVELLGDPAAPFTEVVIAGKRIRVTAQLALDPASANPEAPPARLNASVSISTADPRGLPYGLVLRSFRATNGRQAWSSRLVLLTTFQYDPQSSAGSAWGGPTWEEGTRATVFVEMKRMGRTHRVVVRPVIVGRLP